MQGVVPSNAGARARRALGAVAACVLSSQLGCGGGSFAQRTSDAGDEQARATSDAAAASEGVVEMTDGQPMPDASEVSVEHSKDAAAMETDSGAPPVAGVHPADAGTDAASMATCPLQEAPDYALCDNAAVLRSELPFSDQDTALGGRGDCARHASGTGGLNLYYRLSVPAASYAHVVATSLAAGEIPLVRVLSTCGSLSAEQATRATPDGVAAFCLHNETATERELILAVGKYSGDAQVPNIQFSLSVEFTTLQGTCAN